MDFEPMVGPQFADMWRTLDEAGLAHPPIPSALLTGLRVQEPWCWSTREIDPLAMYMFGEYPVEVLRGQAPEYVALDSRCTINALLEGL